MNHTKTEQASTWLTYINNVTATKTTGAFAAQDKFGETVTLEWHKAAMTPPNFTIAFLMNSVSSLGITAFKNVEMQFLRMFPKVVGQEPYFKPFEPLFKNGIEAVEWQEVAATMETVIKSHFVMDTEGIRSNTAMLSAFAEYVFFFIIAKNKIGNVLGFISFMVKPDFAYGTVKVTSLAVEPIAQNRGLAKLLMSSLFAILPQTERISLCTRVTNATALKAYSSWGFVKDENPTQDPHYIFNLQHWMFMEYKADQTDALQKVAKTLIA